MRHREGGNADIDSEMRREERGGGGGNVDLKNAANLSQVLGSMRFHSFPLLPCPPISLSFLYAY
jgi:hypothetical protein